MSQQPCGCCAGIQVLTPENEANPPGQTSLSYRVGTYGAFYETMLARLSTLTLDVPSADGPGATVTIHPLQQLTTREPSDPSIALLDAWAVVADVLTFYQERIANEGYLATATERRSLLELGRLVAYTLRPGVSASVYLAFTVQNGFIGTIPAGTRAQSMPGSGQMPQFYETAADLNVSALWNTIQPRLTRPQVIAAAGVAGLDPATLSSLYFDGVATNLKVGDAVIVDGEHRALRVVETVTPQATDQRTLVAFRKDAASAAATAGDAAATTVAAPIAVTALTSIANIVGTLAAPPSQQPPNSISLPRTVGTVFASDSDIAPRLLAAFNPAAATTLYTAWSGISTGSGKASASVSAVRAKAAIFANNFAGVATTVQTQVQKSPIPNATGLGTYTVYEAPILANALYGLVSKQTLTAFPLDAVYDQIAAGSLVGITRPDLDEKGLPDGKTVTTFHKVVTVQTVSRETATAEGKPTGFTAKVTQLTFDRPWLYDLASTASGAEPAGEHDDATAAVLLTPFDRALLSTALLRETVVYAQAETLTLAEEPLESDVEGATIELDGLYNGFESGRWVIVSGNRTDISTTNTVPASELVMIAGVSQSLATYPGDTVHTSLTLANKLAYTYDRSTLTIYGNVTLATNGQSVGQVLGNGDTSQAFQTFALNQTPLTYLSAPTLAGAQSTLTVTVNDTEWQETDDLAALGPNDHYYITQTNNSAVTSVTFGNGTAGARVPTGTANVKALYRYGIGSAGNVAAGQISQLATRPLGAQSVTNPLPASGGADPDTVTQARANTPIAVKALDRLVSIQDYADFCRAYAGIGKAASIRLSNGRRQLVFVTIAGAEDIPIDTNSDLYKNLLQSLQQFGDPSLPILVDVRSLKLLVIAAGIQVLPGYQFEDVELAVQAALLNTFSFDNRNLAQPAFLSEAVAAMQSVPGVDFVNVSIFDSVAEDVSAADLSSLSTSLIRRNYVEAKSAYVSSPSGQQDLTINPAELVYLTPTIADTLLLTEITSTDPGPRPKFPRSRVEVSARRNSRRIRRPGGNQ